MVSKYDRRYQLLIRRLREARLEAGLTQTEVGERLGILQSLVSRIESGERKIDPIEFAELCRLYGKAARFFVPDLPM